MLKLTKPKLSEYVFVGLVIFIVIACLLPTCNPFPSAEYNQDLAQISISNVISSQKAYYEKFGRYGSTEELVSPQSPLNPSESLGNKRGYRIDVESDGKTFQITATPLDYGRSGKLSYYADNSDFKIHAADRQGQSASITDPLVKQ